jgi:hypothetical protein
MVQNSEDAYDTIFLSYQKILKRFEVSSITTKHDKPITHKDLRKAVDVMLEKHSKCRWRSEKIRSKRYYILIEGYYWLIYVYFQKEKKQIDADIDFFVLRITQYEDLLQIEPKNNYWEEDMTIKELCNYFNRDISTIKKAIAKMVKETGEQHKYYKDGKTVISKEGVEWLCKNCFKQTYLKLLENYKMELTEKYIEAGYPYDVFFNRN